MLEHLLGLLCAFEQKLQICRWISPVLWVFFLMNDQSNQFIGL